MVSTKVVVADSLMELLIRNYFVEGRRKVKWGVEEYELYPGTFSSLVHSLIKAGFITEECQESRISDEIESNTRYPARLHRLNPLRPVRAGRYICPSLRQNTAKTCK